MEEDRAQQLSSLVSCIEIGKEVSERAGARSKKFNMSRSPKGKMHHIFPLTLFEVTFAIHNSHFTISNKLPQSPWLSLLNSSLVEDLHWVFLVLHVNVKTNTLQIFRLKTYM